MMKFSNAACLWICVCLKPDSTFSSNLGNADFAEQRSGPSFCFSVLHKLHACDLLTQLSHPAPPLPEAVAGHLAFLVADSEEVLSPCHPCCYMEAPLLALLWTCVRMPLGLFRRGTVCHMP